jgi:hypothetical protein
MRHSVRVRAAEIDEWSMRPPHEAADALEDEFNAFGRAIRNLRLPPFLAPQAGRSYHHLYRWADALRLVKLP